MRELTDAECTEIARKVGGMMGALGGTLTESEGNYLRNFGFALIRAGYAAALASQNDEGMCQSCVPITSFRCVTGPHCVALEHAAPAALLEPKP